MKKVLKILLFTFLIISFFSLPVLAVSKTYTLEKLGLDVTIPSGYDVITQNTSPSNPVFDRLGTTRSDLIKQFETDNIYLNAIPEDTVDEEIVVTMIADDTIENFSVLSDTTLKTLASSWINEYEKIGVKVFNYDIYQHSQGKFIRVYFENTENSAHGLQYYTIYDKKAMNFTMLSYSGEITSNQKKTIKYIVDSIQYDTPPVTAPLKSPTKAFVYTDVDTDAKFTVPDNWYEKELSEDREFLDIMFLSSEEEGMSIIYGSTDLWEMLTPEEQEGLSRSDLDSSFWGISDIATLYGIDESLITKETYDGKSYFQATIRQPTDMRGETFPVEITAAIRIENGWGYWFQFSGTTDNEHFEDFKKLLNSVEYPDYEKEISPVSLKTAITFSVIIIVLAVLLGIFIELRIKKSEEHAFTPKATINRCPYCDASLPDKCNFCHKCGKNLSARMNI